MTGVYRVVPHGSNPKIRNLLPDLRRRAAEGLSYPTLAADIKEKLMCDKPAMRVPIELGKSWAQNVMYGVMATLVNLINNYDKQEINPKMLGLVKLAKHHIPKDHKLIWPAAAQDWTNLCMPEMQVIRHKGNNGKVKFCALLSGHNLDAAVMKAATGPLAMLISAGNKI